MLRYKLVIGIDPDSEKSGVCTLNPSTKQMELRCLTFPALINYLLNEQSACVVRGEKIVVVVEAGWLVSKSNFHPYQGLRAEKIAKNVGANHETGRKIVEMCEWYGINVETTPPYKKGWKGKDRKITHEELAVFAPLPKSRTNQEERDAALIAWNYANLPIIIRSKR